MVVIFLVDESAFQLKRDVVWIMVGGWGFVEMGEFDSDFLGVMEEVCEEENRMDKVCEKEKDIEIKF